jgi:hypothetical protein
MTCPSGLDTITISHRLHDDCDCHHGLGQLAAIVGDPLPPLFT